MGNAECCEMMHELDEYRICGRCVYSYEMVRGATDEVYVQAPLRLPRAGPPSITTRNSYFRALQSGLMQYRVSP
eukprot:6208120-Pleurochrysis_carterae.AAC.3